MSPSEFAQSLVALVVIGGGYVAAGYLQGRYHELREQADRRETAWLNALADWRAENDRLADRIDALEDYIAGAGPYPAASATDIPRPFLRALDHQ